MDHFIATLRQLYSVKKNWEGTKYIGMNIDIDRKSQHVTISMAGYIDKLFQTIRPNGTKGASTPSTYAPPVRYRTFSTGIFYALCTTAIDYLSTNYYSIVACMHLA